MSYYFSLRGWLEVDHDVSRVLTRLLELRQEYSHDSKEALYMKGWTWPAEGINWTFYIFYGADVQEVGLTLFENVLTQLGKLNYHLSGFFHAQSEDDDINFTYRMENDSWSREPSDRLFDNEFDDEGEC